MTARGVGPGEEPSGTEGIPPLGALVGGKFVVEQVLGVGGMGVVVAARHSQLGQSVAIKFLQRTAAKSPDSVNRFLREARACVGLQSAHVVRVMDVGMLEDGLPYMVMEHLQGADMGQILEAGRVLRIEEVVDYLLQSMEAIAEAHSLGIVHRDLKPSNLFVTAGPDGSPLVKVLDFGISKATGLGAELAALTATTAIMGSPFYMSPEQVRSTKNVDARTDVWALGVILYELLAGARPFEAETVTGLCAKIVADPPEPLRSRRPDVPLALEDVLMRCLEKDVKRRYQSVAELAVAIKAFASSEGRTSADRIARIGGTQRAAQWSAQATARSPSGSRLQSPNAAPVSFDNAADGTSPAAPHSPPGALAENVSGPAGYAETVASRQTTRAVAKRWMIVAAAIALLCVLGVIGIGSMRQRAEGTSPAVLERDRNPTNAAAVRGDPAPTSALGSSFAASAPPVAAENSAPPEAAKSVAPPAERPPAAMEPPRGKAPVTHAVGAKPHGIPVKTVPDDLLLDRK
jgi:eukaryotic-like serine/threonine-protein kinase